MASVTFDGTQLVGATYVPRFVKHESAPERKLGTMVPSRGDGEVLVSDNYGVKKIKLQGVLTASTQALLESGLDTFKELFSRPEKNLDIDWGGGTRRYVATCTAHEFDRDHYHLLFAPWTAEFTVLSGEGKDSAATTAVNHAVTTTTPVADSFSLLGSKPPKPRISLAIQESTVKGIEYKNMDTGERIVFNKNADWGIQVNTVVIDCGLKKVTANIQTSSYSEGKFYGTFPTFKIGTNNVRVSAGGIVSQQTNGETVYPDSGGDYTLDVTSVVYTISATTTRLAMSLSFPYRDDTYRGLSLFLAKDGSPGNLTVRLETDNNGAPSGNYADTTGAGSQWTITPGSVGTGTGSVAMIDSYAANLLTFNGNQRYWLVISAAAVNGTDKWYIKIQDRVNGLQHYFRSFPSPTDLYLPYVPYARGEGYISTDSGSTYTPYLKDIPFRIRYGGMPDVSSTNHKVEYEKTYL